jgi:hypothetical protein
MTIRPKCSVWKIPKAEHPSFECVRQSRLKAIFLSFPESGNLGISRACPRPRFRGCNPIYARSSGTQIGVWLRKRCWPRHPVGLQPSDFDPCGRPGSTVLQVSDRSAVSPLLPSLNWLRCGCSGSRPASGLRRDDDHVSACAQFDSTLFRGAGDSRRPDPRHLDPNIGNLNGTGHDRPGVITGESAQNPRSSPERAIHINPAMIEAARWLNLRSDE